MAEPAGVTAPLKRRVICLIYEALILVALLLAAALPVVLINARWLHTSPELGRYLMRAWLLLICGWIYTRQWVSIGQTLPMKTWKIRVVDQKGAALTVHRAWLRYAAVLGSVALLGKIGRAHV